MGIALGTVQDYVKRVYRKLDVNSKRAVRQWVSRYVTAR
jgi:DNA-binding CsgD family transcriptional regulator